MRLVRAHQGHFLPGEQETHELFQGKQGDQHAADRERHIVESLRDRQAGHQGRPGFHGQRRAVPGHGDAEDHHQHFGDGQHDLAQSVRGIMEGDLEAEMVALAHAHGGAEKNEPTHEKQGGGLRPARRLIQHVTAEHLPGDEEGHQYEADPGDPQSRPIHDGEDAGQRGKFSAHR
jgi:hypothetical protein